VEAVASRLRTPAGSGNKASKAIHAVWRGFLTLVGAARAAPPFFRYLPPETQ
jgi:hypothetical protein